MKAYILTRYGDPKDVLELREIEKPKPAENEVLVKIHATTINDYEWAMVRGRPRSYQLLFGIGKPKFPIPGMELSGVIEELGPNAGTFKVGDEVYGDISGVGFGTFAEYISVHENALALKPPFMSFEEAASIPHASMLAYQGLVDTGDIKQHEKILINGAGGGVGTFGLQIAKQFDAQVTGVDTGDKLQTMESIGFDEIIDYKKEDFTRSGKKYDIVLDAKTTRSPFAYLRSLKAGGIYATVGGTSGKLLQASTFGKIINMTSGKKIKIVLLKPNKDLGYIQNLHEEGKLKCIIDGPYPFQEIPNLIQYFGEGKHTGKIVVSIST